LTFGTKSRKARVPLDVGKALVLTLSFTGIGNPCNEPSAAPKARAQHHVAIENAKSVEAFQLLCSVQ